MQVWSWAYTSSRQGSLPARQAPAEARPVRTFRQGQPVDVVLRAGRSRPMILESAGLAVRQGAIELECRLAEQAEWGCAGGVAYGR